MTTEIRRLERDLQEAIADCQERAKRTTSKPEVTYWDTVRGAYQTVLLVMIPSAME